MLLSALVTACVHADDHAPLTYPLMSLTADGHGAVGSSSVGTNHGRGTSPPSGVLKGEGRSVVGVMLVLLENTADPLMTVQGEE